MKINFHSTIPPRVAAALILALSLAFTFPSCSDGSSGGSDDNSEQATNQIENPSKPEIKEVSANATDVANIIENLSAGEHNITVTGAITGDTISAIKTALKNNGKAKINLDLSQTTGLDSIGEAAFQNSSNLTSVSIPDRV